MTDDRIEPPEIHAEDILPIDDPSFEDDNVAVVTGAASGIGRATAIASVAKFEGARVRAISGTHTGHDGDDRPL